MAETKFAFVGVGGSQLSGHLEPPEGTPRGWAIFAHCLTCGKDSRAAVHISRALSRAGIGVLRFDFAVCIDDRVERSLFGGILVNVYGVVGVGANRRLI